MKKNVLFCILFILIVISFSGCVSDPNQSFTRESKPWTYWWWMGSSVTKQDITYNLQGMHEAGIGGVHIIPIYGEKGDDANFINYLSPEWMEMLRHTTSEAERLGMGVDMTTGTGWPFGGPSVAIGDAAKTFFIRSVPVRNKPNFHDGLKKNEKGNLLLIAAYDNKGNYYDLTSQVSSNGTISTGTTGTPAKIYAVFYRPTGQKVKRAAPGAEGWVIDYFDDKSFLNYLKNFQEAFQKAGIEKGEIRSFYNDSYEVYGANWTSDLLLEFEKRRGYDLRPYIRFLADTTSCETRQRVITDYCETVSDLLRDEFTVNWVNKSHQMGSVTRNQAHGSPGNLLDLYALADIPETETFGASGFPIPGLRLDPDYPESSGRPDPLMMKFASSSAHVNGKKLVSSESTTWLADHFKVSLSQIKPQIDELFISGINHVFFHGTTYSPKEKSFPGRLFYASTNYNFNSHFWNELPALTGYISSCQTILQNAKPDNDILLYFPIHDVWKKQKSELFISLIGVHNTKDWLKNSPFSLSAKKLWDNGYSFDYVSDRMLNAINVDGNKISSGTSQYKTILVPACETIPLETLNRLLELAKEGAVIIFEGAIPSDVPGLYEVERRKASLAEIKNSMLSLKGNVHITEQLFETLSEKGVNPEEMKSKGLEFIRKKSDNDIVYFVTNLSNKFGEDWVKLRNNKKYIEIFDPVSGNRGKAEKRDQEDSNEIYLQLEPGQSCIITCTDNHLSTRKWSYLAPIESRQFEIKGDWKLTPKEGAPEIPSPVDVKQFESWTAYGGSYKTFSGKAVYSTSFEVAGENQSPAGYMLDLGNVRETARVKINGKDIGLIWCLPNRVIIPKGIIKQKNNIEIEVTNLSINRVIDLDKKGVNWKNFYDINFVNIKYQPFDASNNEPEDSGLLSPVYLIPLNHKDL